MSFENVFGQKRVVKLLSGIAAHQRVANGYLFCGPVNSGQREAAEAFSRALGCSQPITVVPDGRNIKKEQIKELIKQTRFGPVNTKWLVAIIDEAQAMTLESANSFLKVLEEPPERTVFILITYNEDALLETIVSRCQRIAFNYLPANAETPELVEDPRQFSVADRLRRAEELGNDKDQVRSYLDRLLRHFFSERDFSSIKVVLRCLQRLNYNVNVRLCLEDMFLAV